LHITTRNRNGGIIDFVLCITIRANQPHSSRPCRQ
jgi:hypothetical protein